MGERADRTIAALRSGHDELAAQVAGMTLEDLGRASGSAEWTVAQVLSHLGSGAEISLAALDAALAGAEPPPQERNAEVWARWDALGPEAHRDEFLRADEELVARYEGLDDATRESLRIDLGFLPRPVDVALAAAMRLSEFALHQWDVRVTFDPAATLAPAAVEPLLEPVGMLIGFLGKPDALDGDLGTLAVHTSQPEQVFGLELGSAIAVVDAPERPIGVLDTPAESWLRLVSGRLATENTPATVKLSSDAVTLADLRRAFPGY